jgi:Family of unknown function (DUF6785)/Domain of unknown function (DUF6784)
MARRASRTLHPATPEAGSLPLSSPARRDAVAAPSLMPRAVTWRSVLVGLVLIPLNAYWLVQMERVRYSAHPTTVSLFFNVVFILLVLQSLNMVVARLRPRAALERGELLVIYAMLAVASTLASHDMFQILVPMLPWPYRFADGGNRWDELFFRYLPRWLMVPDMSQSQGFFGGNSNLYTRPHLLAWLVPAVAWCTFTSVLLYVMLCVNAILRKQWTDRERLTYPIVQLPLEMTAGEGGRPGRVFRSRLFYLGFALAGTVDMVNGLNLYYPWIPSILTPGFGQSFLDLHQFFPTKPWNAIGWTPISWYPFLIGLGILMPLDFLFSAWFFYLFWKLEAVVTVAMAWDQDSRFPYQNAQAFGAYMAFLCYTIWLSRGYLAQVGRKVLGMRSDLDDSAEPMSYRAAALGIVLGVGALVGFSSVLGMPVWIGLLFFLIYFALALAITRMRAELGTPIHDLHFTGPDWTLAESLGTRALDARTLGVFSLYFWFNRAYRGHPMPHQLEGFKLAEQSRTPMRPWTWAIMLAGIAGAFAAFWAMLHLMYDYGARAKSAGTFGPEAYNRLAGWLKNPTPSNQTAINATIVGFAIAMFLQWMRVRVPWWPFHPLGFAVTSSWEINLVWMPLFIAWVLKAVLLRYTGLKGFRASIPFFFGLILGQFVVGSLWNIYGIVFEVPTYQFWQ